MLGVILFYELPPLFVLRLSQPRFWLYAALYPITPVMLLILLVVQYRSMCWLLPLYPYFAAWTVDAGGYFVGNLFGRHRCFPIISPKKTWEGLVGSMFALFAFHLSLAWWYGVPYTYVMLSAMTVLISGTAILGDLFVSFLKRRAGIKDTGKLLPGHGGLLDRFDSVLFVVIVMQIFLAFEPRLLLQLG